MTKKITTLYLKYLQQNKIQTEEGIFLFGYVQFEILWGIQWWGNMALELKKNQKRAWNENLGIFHINMILISSEGVKEPNFWCRCSTIVLAKQSLMVSLTLTGLKLTFRSEERIEQICYLSFVFCSLRGSWAVWLVLLWFYCFYWICVLSFVWCLFVSIWDV